MGRKPKCHGIGQGNGGVWIAKHIRRVDPRSKTGLKGFGVTRIETHAESSQAEHYEPVNISGESVQEAKCESETRIETHAESSQAEQYEPVKLKPISTKVFYKGKQLSKRQADSLASDMAKEEDQSKLGK